MWESRLMRILLVEDDPALGFSNRIEHRRIDGPPVLQDMIRISSRDGAIDETCEVVRERRIVNRQPARHAKRAGILRQEQQHARRRQADEHHDWPLAPPQREPLAPP